MDYRRTRQPSPQQPHAAKSTARPATGTRTGTGAPPRSGFGQAAPPTVPMRPHEHLTARPVPRPTPELGVQGLRYDYTTPVSLEAVAADLTLSEEETERLKTAADIVALCKRWQRMPTFDLEYMPGFDQWSGELAHWHDEQLKIKAHCLGCSLRTITILEELVRCFIDNRPPQGILARRLLLEY